MIHNFRYMVALSCITTITFIQFTNAKHICLDSPATRTVLTALRNNKSSTTEFRKATKMAASFLVHEVMKHLDMPSMTVTTPCGIARGNKISNGIVCIPILRAGLSLVDTFLEYFPEARVGMIGLRRDEETARAHCYYNNVPPIHEDDMVIILEPMVATGGSLLFTLENLEKKGITQDQIIIASVISVPEGINAIQERFPNITIITLAHDPELNTKKFINPGLGDFGDRFFGTM